MQAGGSSSDQAEDPPSKRLRRPLNIQDNVRSSALYVGSMALIRSTPDGEQVRCTAEAKRLTENHRVDVLSFLPKN